MITCKESNGYLQIVEHDLFFSTSIIFDTKNELLIVDKRRWIFFKKSFIHRFSDVDYLYSNYKEYKYGDGFTDGIYILEILNNAGSILWNCEIYNDEHFYRKILNELHEKLGANFRLKSLKAHSVICKYCKRLISKSSNWCIYCGKTKAGKGAGSIHD